MKRYLKTIYDEQKHDGILFMLTDNDYLDVATFTYATRTKPIDSHKTLGLKYHIITYKETTDGDVVYLDNFEAIIGNPWHYVGSLIECGFLGFICKKTRLSKKAVNDMYQRLEYRQRENLEEEFDVKRPVKY